MKLYRNIHEITSFTMHSTHYIDFLRKTRKTAGRVSGNFFTRKDPKTRRSWTLADGHIYKGQYLNGKRHGQGKKTYKSGKVEEGEWKEGEFIG